MKVGAGHANEKKGEKRGRGNLFHIGERASELSEKWNIHSLAA